MDMSNLCIFGWYEWVYYKDFGPFLENRERLGRVLGSLRNEGNEMAQAVLTSNGTVIPRRTLRKLTKSERHDETEKVKRETFDTLIRDKLGDAAKFPDKPLPD